MELVILSSDSQSEFIGRLEQYSGRFEIAGKNWDELNAVRDGLAK
jgi:hypothetical protein